MIVCTDNNNFYSFMDIKNLYLMQVRWTEKLSKYHFWIDNCREKINGAVNALSQFSKRSKAQQEAWKAENSHILFQLQILMTMAYLGALTMKVDFLILYQFFIFQTYVLPNWIKLQTTGKTERANK